MKTWAYLRYLMVRILALKLFVSVNIFVGAPSALEVLPLLEYSLVRLY